jgi:hypothetical protein
MGRFIVNIAVAFVVFVLLSTYMDTGGLGLADLRAKIWPQGAVFIVVYGGIKAVFEYFRDRKGKRK